jgi:hypothetical protein
MVVSRWVQRVLSTLGIDPAVAVVLGGNVGIGILSLIQISLITARLTPAEQGVNFNYLAIFQIILLFDFGFGLVIQQLVSHERAFLHETPARILEGPPATHARLASLLHVTGRWYLTLYVLVTAIALPAGWFFFDRTEGLQNVDWQFAWIATAFVSSGCTAAIGLAKFLSGCGDVLAVARMTILQTVLVSLAYCIIMALGGKLFAFPGGQICGLIVPLIWLVVIRRPLLANLWRTSPGASRLSWRHDVRPFQSRIALSLISAQAFQLIVPIALKSYSPEVSGRLGMSLAVVAALQMLGLTWLETRVPVFGNLIAKRNWPELDRVYRHVLVKSTAFLAAILGLLVAATFLVSAWDQPAAQQLMSRFLQPVPAALLVLITLANHVFYVRAAYLRAHCKEPYMVVTVVQAAALIATMLIAGRFANLEIMLAGCLFWTLALGQGVGYWIFRTMRRDWHAPFEEVKAEELKQPVLT